MSAVRIPKRYRLPPETVAKIEAIAAARGGLTATRVLELAVDALADQVLGRRAADLVPPRARDGRRSMPG